MATQLQSILEIARILGATEEEIKECKTKSRAFELIAKYHSNIDVEKLIEIAEGKVKPFVAVNGTDFCNDLVDDTTWGDDFVKLDLEGTYYVDKTFDDLHIRVGDVILLAQTEVPDYWVMEINETSMTLSKLESRSLNVSTLIDIGNGQTTFDSKVFPTITKAVAKEIYETYTSGVGVIVKWSVMNVLPIEASVISSDNIGNTFTFDIIIHNEYMCEYSYTTDGDNVDMKIVKLGGDKKYKVTVFIQQAYRDITFSFISTKKVTEKKWSNIIDALKNSIDNSNVLNRTDGPKFIASGFYNTDNTNCFVTGVHFNTRYNALYFCYKNSSGSMTETLIADEGYSGGPIDCTIEEL